MKPGVVTDDFNDAPNEALPMAEAGMNVSMFIRVPNISPDSTLNSGFVALKSHPPTVAAAVR